MAGAGHSTNRDFLVLSYQARNGFTLWENRIQDNKDSFANAIVVDGTRVFVCGIIQEDPTTLILVASEAANGALLWENRIDGGFSDSHYLAAINGRLLVVGDTATKDIPTNRHRFVRAYDSKTGTLHWSDQDTTSISGFHGLAVDDQKRLFAIGLVLNAAGNSDGLMRVYDARL